MNLLARFMEQNKKDQSLTVTGDGLQTRDFVHVSDVAEANYMAATCAKSKCDGSVYNVGSGESYRIIDIARLINTDIEFVPNREGEILHSTADISKIKADMGWNPKICLHTWLQDQLSHTHDLST